MISSFYPIDIEVERKRNIKSYNISQLKESSILMSIYGLKKDYHHPENSERIMQKLSRERLETKKL